MLVSFSMRTHVVQYIANECLEGRLKQMKLMMQVPNENPL
jgi:hypothetical protein